MKVTRSLVSVVDDDESVRESLPDLLKEFGVAAGLVRVPPIEMLPLEDAARAHWMIETGHVRGNLVLKVAELSS